MSDIFQEVEEDLRRERLRKVWDRYGIFVIAAALLIVVVTAGWRGYEAWQTNRARGAGETYSRILAQAEGALTATPADRLLAFADGSPSGYALLARFRAGTVYDQAGQQERAAQTFRELAGDASVPSLYQDLASIRLAQTLIDMGEAQEARTVVAPLAEDAQNPFNSSAQEMAGLAAYAAGDMAEARRWFSGLRDAAGTPQALQRRAEFMVALIDQSTGLGAGGEAAAPGPSAAGETN